MEGKNELFQRLKPHCVALGQATLTLNGSRGNLKPVTDHLESLNYVLASATSTKPNALDAKLAEYVFFPIAQLLKVSQKISVRCLELSLQCVSILIDQGWRQDIPAKLAAQIIILCSLLAERNSKGLSFSETTEELQASAFWCLYHLFTVVGRNAETKELLTSESHFPQLGQTISVILEGIQSGGSVEAQIAATSALDALVTNVADREVQASFLPGIVSKLTRILTPGTKLRRNHRVVIGSLAILRLLLQNTLGDAQPSGSENGMNGHNTSADQTKTKSIIDAKWRESAATQLKPALTKILRLKSHSRDDVRDAVASLCLALLQDCRSTLSNCSQLAIEVLLTIAAGHSDGHSSRELAMLIRMDEATAGLLQSVLFDWLQALPMTMQGSEEQAKVSRLEQIRTAYELLSASGTDASTIDRTLATTLRDSIVVTLAVPNSKRQSELQSSQIHSLDMSVLNGGNISTTFASPLIKYRSQEEILAEIEKFVEFIGNSTSEVTFASDLHRNLRYSHGEAQIANLWLLITATQTALDRASNVDDFLNFENDAQSIYKQYLEELYAFSLSMLMDPTDEPIDPRLQALALRGLALRAQTEGLEFRFELVDALYPVLHTLATPDDQLQHDSITTLNVFTSACGYRSVRDLIVDNVDYLTNAVALKLNAFDVSPQAPQVLLMMVRLAGPSLLPYLEDTIESIFAALEDYHGYPLLVELLFKVLSVVAEEGVKVPQLAITQGAVERNNIMAIEKWDASSVEALATQLRRRGEDLMVVENVKQNDLESHPQKPWSTINKERVKEEDLDVNGHEDQPMDDADPPPPAPKTYNLLFKIAELTQHYLPSASGSLRTSLLSLIKTTVPAIAQHENSFLPLINTLWPEVTSRLEDDEPYIVATALEIVKLLCEYAGDFMRGRILQLWPRLVEIYQSTAQSIVLSPSTHGTSAISSHSEDRRVGSTTHLKNAIVRLQATPADYGDTTTRLLWSSLAATITAVVQYVQISPEIFDEALEMAEPLLEDRNIQEVFARANADAVWLATVRNAASSLTTAPKVPEHAAWQFVEAHG